MYGYPLGSLNKEDPTKPAVMTSKDRARVLKELKERDVELEEKQLETIRTGDLGHGFGHLAFHRPSIVCV